MAKTVKVGNLYIEVPNDHILASAATPASPQTLRAERPEVPRMPEEIPYQSEGLLQAVLDQCEDIDKMDPQGVIDLLCDLPFEDL